MPNVLDQLDRFGPDHCPQLSVDEARAYVQGLAKSHYENFSVVSWFLPRRLRDDFRHVYAYCRWADDLGDETGNNEAGRQRSVELLNWWRRELDLCYDGKPRHPVFVALQPTIEKHDIPRQPFDDLIDAFLQDQSVRRYNTWEQVLEYCQRSANPVGRLVLYLCGYRDEQRQQLSDATCTALQLANFWQDVRRDITDRDRVYIPSDIASRHRLDIDTMVHAVKVEHQSDCERFGPDGAKACCDRRLPSAGITGLLPAYRSTLKELCDRTDELFQQGRALWPLVDRDVRLDIQLFTLGGEAVLKMIRRMDHNTLATRPSVGTGAKFALMVRALSAKWFGFGLGSKSTGTPADTTGDGMPQGTEPWSKP